MYDATGNNIIGNATLWDDGHFDSGGSDYSVVGSALRDTLWGYTGTNTFNGGLGLDNLRGGDGVDTFIYKAGYGAGSGTAAGTMHIDGGAGLLDKISVDGGGLVSLKGVAVTNIEQIALTDAAGTTLTLGNDAQAALITSAVGANDHVVMSTDWIVDFGVIGQLFSVGVEHVNWKNGAGQDFDAYAFGSYVDIIRTDTPNIRSYSQIETAYLNGVRAYDWVNYDDGSYAVVKYEANGVDRQSTNLFDYGDAASWNTITEQYSGNLVTLRTTVFDGGSNHPVNNFNTPYNTLVETYSPAGTLGTAVYLYKDGHQSIFGGTGANLLVESTAFNDGLKGDLGADTFKFTGAGRDTVTDFLQGTDHLDFTAYSLNGPAVGGLQSIAVVGSNTILTVGDVAGHQIVLQGFTGTLVGSDFVGMVQV